MKGLVRMEGSLLNTFIIKWAYTPIFIFFFINLHRLDLNELQNVKIHILSFLVLIRDVHKGQGRGQRGLSPLPLISNITNVLGMGAVHFEQKKSTPCTV